MDKRLNELRLKVTPDIPIMSDQFDLEDSVPLIRDVIESTIKPDINVCVFLKELDEMMGVKRENGAYKIKVDIDETTHSTEHEYEATQSSEYEKEATYPHEIEEKITQSYEHEEESVETDGNIQKTKRAVAFVIDIGSGDDIKIQTG